MKNKPYITVRSTVKARVRFESITEVRLEKIIFSFENKFSIGKDEISIEIVKRFFLSY